MQRLIGKIFSVTILGLGTFSSSASASDFMMLQGDKAKSLLDRDSIVRTGTTAKATVISVYLNTSSEGEAGYSATREFSCTTRRVRDLKTTYFFKNGSTRQDFKVEPWRNVLPNTILETFLDMVCNRP